MRYFTSCPTTGVFPRIRPPSSLRRGMSSSEFTVNKWILRTSFSSEKAGFLKATLKIASCLHIDRKSLPRECFFPSSAMYNEARVSIISLTCRCRSYSTLKSNEGKAFSVSLRESDSYARPAVGVGPPLTQYVWLSRERTYERLYRELNWRDDLIDLIEE